MYSCVLNETNNGAILLKDSEEVANLKLHFISDNVYIDVEKINKEAVVEGEEITRPLSKFAFNACKKVEEALLGKGVNVDKVVFGRFADIIAFDEYLSELETIMDKESFERVKGKSPSKR